MLAYNIKVNRLERNALVFVLVSLVIGTGLNLAGRLALHRHPIEPETLPATETLYIKKVNINTATQQQLEQLPGIGPSTAKEIIRLRQKKHGFKSLEELLEVRGIGEKKLQAIRPFLDTGTGDDKAGSNQPGWK